MRKPHFCISRTFKKCIFFTQKAFQNRTFFTTPLGTQFFQFSTSKNTFFWPNMEPNLGSKTLHFLTNRHRETSNPPKTSQDPQNLLQNPSRTPPELLQASPKRVQSITFRPHLAKSVSFSQILAQQHNKSTFKILTGPNTQYAFHFSLLYIRGTLVSVYPPPRSALGT